ncbi:G-protein coupled receptor 3 [Heterocephalus glaber]|uniref:G-protein coupled receptor 3 n=1 Tax=Heterocephalus glaber TaxID=10181 RepID=G5AUT7_HETGA|nr:G-protein coupled receptor 3 [Heterocephalus glaber]XP_021118810.1 G-protein coupled receptor 3 [Heterocephalus glaber]EHB00798.1 G-protein coupled receptor 3 [Heterocephalus glaber]
MMWGAGSPLAWLSSGPGNMNLSSIGPAEGPTGSAASLPLPRAWDVVLCISGTLVSCENALVVAIIVGTPAFRAPMFLLVGSLAVADLLAGLGLVLHFAAVFCIGWVEMSLVLVGMLVMAFTASIGSLLAITVDRYLSLYNALTYYSETTVTRTYVMLALVWGGALGLGLLPVLAWNCLDGLTMCGVIYPLSKNHLVVLAIAFFMVFGIMLQLYAQICRIVCRHAQQIALQRHLLPASHYVATRKGIATLAVVLGAFAACWLPFTIYCLLGDAESPRLYTYLTLLPATYNSMINPIIYAFRNQDVQKVLWAICCCCSSSKIPFRSRSPSDV